MKAIFLSLITICSILFLNAQITYNDAFPNLTFNFPIELKNSGVAGDDRLFVVEQPGRIKVFDNNSSTTSTTTFLDITSQVNYSAGQEKGLLGLAFHPDYNQNGYFYVYYTGSSGGLVEIIIERFEVDPNNPNLADASSGCEVLAFVKNQNNSNHNGGNILFGPDGYLYISVGDGGGGGDPQNNGQNNQNLFGAILRIDIDASCPGYAIPPDNPFVNATGSDEIYAYGIRNTWKMSYDFQTNILWAGDVGQNQFEEINHIENGGNYGWNRYEATTVYDASAPEPANPIFPVYFYNQNQGDVSITGGYVYRGNEITSTSPDIYGKYVFADYVTGRVWYLDYDPSTGSTSRTLLFDAAGIFVSSFGIDIHNELYFLGYGSSGKIYQFVDGFTPPNATAVNGFGNFCDQSLNTNGTVNSIETDGNGNIYVAGDFLSAGNIAANNIALYDGTNWSDLNGGTNGEVYTLALNSNGELFAGGNFTEIGGVAVNNIAKWNGTNWTALAAGTDGPVLVLEFDALDNLYIGGTFVNANGTEANNIAKWNNNVWSVFTDATNSITGTGNEIRSIAIDELGTVYVGGNFASAGGNTANRIATWNGTNWGTLGIGTSGFVQAIEITSDYIYAGGNFAIAGTQTVNRISRWNRTTLQWEKIENGLSGNVNDIEEKDGFIYVGGAFNAALNNSPTQNYIVNGLVRWSAATGWQALGTSTNVGVDNLVRHLQFDDQQLYVGGNFATAGNSSSDNIAKWDFASVGDACDDGNDCTVGETIDANCNCLATVFTDSDMDGVCDSIDVCPNLNDNLIGTACDDGDICTTGETYDNNCNCSGGIFTDADNDEICDAEDSCPNLNNNLIGTACDDGIACTTGETYDANCNCSGGILEDADGDGICTNDDANDNDPCVPIACCEEITLTINFDNYPEETSWAIEDENGTNVASGGTYPNAPDGSTDAFTNCLDPGCYDLIFSDSFGDGICCQYGNGSFSLTNASNEILGSGADFGSSVTINFCVIPQCSVTGNSCDDGDICTTGETFDEDCNCNGGTLSDVCNTCPLVRNLTDQNFDYVSTTAENELYSSIKVLTGSDESYQAGNFIMLMNNFEVELNATFEAIIDTCE